MHTEILGHFELPVLKPEPENGAKMDVLPYGKIYSAVGAWSPKHVGVL